MNNDIFLNTFKISPRGAIQIQIGCWSALANLSAPKCWALAGFDWLVLLTANMRQTISAHFIPQLMALKCSASAPVVRVPTNDPVIVKRLLDIGFYNFPSCLWKTEEQAAPAVASTRYPPERDPRRFCLTLRQHVWHRAGLFAQPNSNITVLVQIESQ